MAEVAAARKLSVRLYFMLKQNAGYPEIVLIEGHPRSTPYGERLYSAAPRQIASICSRVRPFVSGTSFHMNRAAKMLMTP